MNKRLKKDISLILILAIGLLIFGTCNKDKDTTEPEVLLETPINCDSIRQGDFIHMKATFTDNDELARYAVDIRQNFDHESYGESDQGCNLDPEKTPFNPFKYGVVEEIPDGLKSFTKELNILVPESTDKGDYLMIVYAQDKRGLQRYQSISLKMVNDDR